MALILNGTTGITNPGAYTGDGVSFADNTPSNTLVTTTGGNVGIGTSSPAVRVHAVGTNQSVRVQDSAGAAKYIQMRSDASNSHLEHIGGPGDSLRINNQVAGQIEFLTSNTERMRIDSSGAVLVGKTTVGTSGQGCVLSPNGNNLFTLTDAGAGDTLNVWHDNANAYRFYVTRGGTIFATSTTISAISDQRLKENVQDIDEGLDKVMALKPRKFDWKSGKGKDIKGDRGWIAQEFEQVFPDMIDTWKDKSPEGEEPYKSVRADLIPVLVKAMQEQQAIIESQTAALQEAVAEINSLKARVEALEGAQA